MAVKASPNSSPNVSAVLLGELSPSEMELVFRSVQEFVDSLCINHPYSEVHGGTIGIATKYGLTIYDSAYMALALAIKAKFITTDVTLADRLRNTDLEEILVTPARK